MNHLTFIISWTGFHINSSINTTISCTVLTILLIFFKIVNNLKIKNGIIIVITIIKIERMNKKISRYEFNGNIVVVVLSYKFLVLN